MEIKAKITQLFNSISESMKFEIDVRDVFLFAGWGMLAYGLYLLAPWIGFSVGGFVLMVIAVVMKD
jgi:hypothetical protein